MFQKGQVTLVVLTGLLLLVVLGAFTLGFFTLGSEILKGSQLRAALEEVQRYVEGCLEDEAKAGLRAVGLDGLPRHMASVECADFAFLQRYGVQVTLGEMTITTTITDGMIALEADYPVMVTRGLTKGTARKFSTGLALVSEIRIQNPAGKVDTELLLRSLDESALIEIPPGSTIKGGTVFLLPLKPQPGLLGNVFEVGPSHVVFTPDAALIIQFQPEDTDKDGVLDALDEDDDNDGLEDGKDSDDDNDGTPDTEEPAEEVTIVRLEDGKMVVLTSTVAKGFVAANITSGGTFGVAKCEEVGCCGNKRCEFGEVLTCAQDCGTCGNLVCEFWETCWGCVADCGRCPSSTQEASVAVPSSGEAPVVGNLPPGPTTVPPTEGTGGGSSGEISEGGSEV